VKEPVWVHGEECFAIHEMVLAQYGGLAGVRDEGLLASALDKPKNLFSYAKPNHFEMAASYAAGIIGNHPFLDGNKRTGFLIAAVFLEVNGWELTAAEESVVEMTLGLASGKLTERDYAAWFERNSRKGT
jgi:death-on-curing protein